MPRRTAPPAHQRHSRAHIRHQRRRRMARYRRLARALNGADGWPLDDPLASLPHTPFIHCSCNLCNSRHLYRGTDRMIARRAWRREVREALVERMDRPGESSGHPDPGPTGLSPEAGTRS